MGKTNSSPALRRSARVNIGFAVKISGMLANRQPFAENTQIVTVSKFGAKLKTRIPLKVGMQVKVEPLRGEKSGIFKVVWVGREGTPRAGEVGIEYAREIADIVGIKFPDVTGPV
ncbi:MAG: hypothetical protein ABSF45_04910 [Terriglobia bacterium]|jgi:hypothetical protein